MRSDRPWPRQSSVATAKPRERRSRTVSKYFSIHSARHCKMTTVPLRPAGGSQRAKRKLTPSGVFNSPATKLSGTGLAGMETSFMEIVRGSRPDAYNSPSKLLNLMPVRDVRRRLYAAAIRRFAASTASWIRNIFQYFAAPCAIQGTHPYQICAGRFADAHLQAWSIRTGQPHVAQGGYAMRTYDLAPLYRSTVGFDRLVSLLYHGLECAAAGYP